MKKVSIGGQAVLEGIMMKGPDSYALAVRCPDNTIDVNVTPFQSVTERHAVLRIPIIRGVAAFIESLYIGMKTLMQSSEYYDEDEGNKADETGGVSGSKNGAAERVSGSDAKVAASSEKKSASDTAYLVTTLIISLAIAIGIFVLLPTFIANLLYKFTDSDLLVNLVEGVLRLIIFLGYTAAISLMPDIKRTFMYHGAEHKTIACLEAGDTLTVENVRKHTRYHKRCGTSFVFIVMLISVVAFMFIHTETLWLRLLSRLLLIPVISGVSYEFIRYAGRHENAFANVLSAPGLWVQRLTTREPDDSMIEVGIASVKAVIDADEYTRCVKEDAFEK